MNNRFLYGLIIILFASCATSKQTRSFTKDINGSWQLKTIVTEGVTGKFKTGIFSEADFNCFVGSTWNFISDRKTGVYTVPANAVECPTIRRDFSWSIYEAKDQPKIFEFKRLDKDLKEMDATSYRFTIMNVDNNSMQLKTDISFEGKPAVMIYNFVRI